jgi:arginase family enzyme
MINKLLTPVRTKGLLDITGSPLQMGRCMEIHTGEAPDTYEKDLAIITVNDYRGGDPVHAGAVHFDEIRKHLYSLINPHDRLRLIDAGEVLVGETPEDTCNNLKLVTEFFLAQRIIPIIIGGSQDLSIGQYKAYEFLGQAINLAVVDERIDIDHSEDAPPHHNWLLDVFSHHPNYLFNFSALACQGHYVNNEIFNTIENLYFDTCRLGRLREDFTLAEPELRDADMLSFDLSAIKGADAQGVLDVSPNGITSEDACQLMRYAGMSDKLSSMGIFNYKPSNDQHTLTAQLIAQMVWYFIDGFYNRKHDYPITDESDFTKYIVNLSENEYDLTFWKSKKSGRWWLEVPFTVEQKYERQQLVPCAYGDYEDAMRNELPDRWLRMFEKLTA